jgi:SAM-dependent methyltransferase
VRQFANHFRTRLENEFPGYEPPSEQGAPGEEAVLRSFSREWLHYDWDERAYWGQSADDLYRSMAFALDLEHKDLRDRLVLEVGIGIGGIANHLSRSLECELVGIDLSYAVDAAQRNFKENPFFHIVQASAFAPPFAEGAFDYVFSQGVLHHTFSTEAAFQAITKLPREGGRLYVWLYSHRDEARTLKRRILFGVERFLRPVYSRLPEPLQTVALAPWAPLYIAHQWLAARGNDQLTTYSWREAMHAARDRWTPRFVHRHSDEEVARWFTAASYDGSHLHQPPPGAGLRPRELHRGSRHRRQASRHRHPPATAPGRSSVTRRVGRNPAALRGLRALRARFTTIQRKTPRPSRLP